MQGENRIDLPVSALVAHLVRGVEQGNGAATVAALAEEIAAGEDTSAERVLEPLADAARLLLADGVFVARDGP